MKLTVMTVLLAGRQVAHAVDGGARHRAAQLKPLRARRPPTNVTPAGGSVDVDVDAAWRRAVPPLTATMVYVSWLAAVDRVRVVGDGPDRQVEAGAARPTG